MSLDQKFKKETRSTVSLSYGKNKLRVKKWKKEQEQWTVLTMFDNQGKKIVINYFGATRREPLRNEIIRQHIKMNSLIEAIERSKIWRFWEVRRTGISRLQKKEVCKKTEVQTMKGINKLKGSHWKEDGMHYEQQRRDSYEPLLMETNDE